MKEALGQALASRPEGQDALEAVRDFIVSSHAVEKSDLDEGLHRMINDDETLRSHLRARLSQIEELVGAAIAEDLGAAEDDVRPQVVAASLTAAFDVLFEQSGDHRTKPKSADEVAALIDPVMTFLRGGLQALK
jgi:MftR C-terminal domain